MNNFKSGSGNLDFGADDDEDNAEESELESPQAQTSPDDVEAESDSSVNQETDNAAISGRDRTEQATTNSTSSSTEPADSGYPYFVRRSNVGDERDKRLEIHVREQVAEEEGQFRNQLAEILDTNEVSKTDAREFALLAAFQHPEQVAELMREEGFGAVN